MAIERTRTDAERIEHLAEADGDNARVIQLEVNLRPWLAGTVLSAVQVQTLEDQLPRDAMDHGGIAADREQPRAEQHERDPE